MTELWRPVPGLEDRYEVSDAGRVRSLTVRVYAGQGRTRISPGRVLSAYRGDRYVKVSLKQDGRQFGRNVHRLVAEAFLGPCPQGMEVCHNNGDAHDNRLSNLRYDTHANNSLDRRAHGTAFRRREEPECFHGHPYSEGSFYVDRGSGKRVCLECEADRGNRRRADLRAAEGRPHRSQLTHCKQGHPFDGHNGRQKVCRTCAREATRRSYAKKKASRASADA